MEARLRRGGRTEGGGDGPPVMSAAVPACHTCSALWSGVGGWSLGYTVGREHVLLRTDYQYSTCSMHMYTAADEFLRPAFELKIRGFFGGARALA